MGGAPCNDALESLQLKSLKTKDPCLLHAQWELNVLTGTNLEVLGYLIIHYSGNCLNKKNFDHCQISLGKFLSWEA